MPKGDDSELQYIFTFWSEHDTHGPIPLSYLPKCLRASLL